MEEVLVCAGWLHLAVLQGRGGAFIAIKYKWSVIAWGHARVCVCNWGLCVTMCFVLSHLVIYVSYPSSRTKAFREMCCLSLL